MAISIHSLRMEGDDSELDELSSRLLFQSTPSAWRETYRGFPIRPPKLYFNPLPPHGGRRFRLVSKSFGSIISIHSLRMEGDAESLRVSTTITHFNPLPPHGGRRIRGGSIRNGKNFNPLPPHGGRRLSVSFCHNFVDISIHSLRMEGDHAKVLKCA